MDEVVNHPSIIIVARRIIALGGAIMLLDGFDVQAIGFAASAICHDLGIAVDRFGVVFSAGLIGALFGSLLLSPLADHFGRKPMIVLTAGLFGLFTVATPVATSIEMLCVLRFLAGIGLGGAIPNVIAHCVEYVPARRRGLVVGLLYGGFPVGGMIGAATAALVIPTFGWKALFFIGGILPFVVIPVFCLLAPESLQFLASSAQRSRKLQALMQRLLPELTRSFKPVLVQPAKDRVAVLDVFATGGFRATLLIWIPFFMVLMLLIVMVLWTPALLRQSGLSASGSVLVVALINLGSALGNVWAGRMIDRFGPFIVVPLTIVAGAICLAPMGTLVNLSALLSVCAVGAGFFFGAAGGGMMTLSASWYPAHVRATGFGWAYSMGRLGQVVGPLVTGGLLAAGLSVTVIFLLAAVPATIAAISVALLRTLPHASIVAGERLRSFAVPEAH
jgi:AAHS family 4-hydroxybenzoate transporter-like MFS transporter